MINRTRLLLVFTVIFLCTPAASADESLAGAMRAIYADSFSTALELASTVESNPWLEVYRLQVRAQAFLGIADSISAAGRTISALRLISGGEAEGHPEEGSLIDLAVLCAGPEVALPFITDDISSRLHPGTLLRIGLYHYESGNEDAAAAYISMAAGRKPGEGEMVLLKDLSAAGALDLPGVSPETVASIASAAISAGDGDMSRFLIDLTRSTGDYAWLAAILEGDLLAASGRKTKALVRYRSVFRSDTYPVEGKKKALQRLAALQYRMKKYSDASSSYRTYGLYYPDDTLAEISTDRSARIEIASGRWNAAVDTWRRIADTGPGTLTGREAILAMAVVLERTGRKNEAYDLLLANLDVVGGRLRAAYLYWIIRTCGEQELQSEHSLILTGESANSFYARAIADGPGFLDADEERDSVPAIEMFETITRRSPFPGSGIPAAHPSLGAFRYFTAENMKVRSAVCARIYLATLDNTGMKDCIGTLYSEAREAGLESLCLEMSVAHSALFSRREDYIEYLFPFAFGSEIDSFSGDRSLPPELVLAVIREESRFDDIVESHAGAWGLMQIMPSTGEWIGGKVGRKHITVSDLRDPAFNIEAGCWYLRFLLDRADESIVAALASYNAGHGRMRSWKKRFHPDRDPLAAIELIGPSETRQYVRRVLDTMAAYGRETSRRRR